MLYLDLMFVEVRNDNCDKLHPHFSFPDRFFSEDFFRENGYTAKLEGNLLTLDGEGHSFQFVYCYDLEGIDWSRRMTMDNARFFDVVDRIITQRLRQLVKRINSK
jgi:hypothetical protein